MKVFRGAPSNRHYPDLYAMSQRQRSAWTRDRRVQVVYRTLRYPPHGSAKPPQEKGIDVLIALTVVKLVSFGDFDIVLLASHDTDLEPALEVAVLDSGAKIETCGWAGARVLRPSGKRLWHTALDGSDLVRCRDRRTYVT